MTVTFLDVSVGQNRTVVQNLFCTSCVF